MPWARRNAGGVLRRICGVSDGLCGRLLEDCSFGDVVGCRDEDSQGVPDAVVVAASSGWSDNGVPRVSAWAAHGAIPACSMDGAYGMTVA